MEIKDKTLDNDKEVVEQASIQPTCPSCNSMLCGLLLITANNKACRLDCACRTCGLLYFYKLNYGSKVEVYKQEDKDKHI